MNRAPALDQPVPAFEWLRPPLEDVADDSHGISDVYRAVTISIAAVFRIRRRRWTAFEYEIDNINHVGDVMSAIAVGVAAKIVPAGLRPIDERKNAGAENGLTGIYTVIPHAIEVVVIDVAVAIDVGVGEGIGCGAASEKKIGQIDAVTDVAETIAIDVAGVETGTGVGWASARGRSHTGALDRGRPAVKKIGHQVIDIGEIDDTVAVGVAVGQRIRRRAGIADIINQEIDVVPINHSIARGIAGKLVTACIR